MPECLGEAQLSPTNQSFKLQGFYWCQQLWEVVCSHLRNGFCHCWLDRGWKKRNLTIRNEWSLIRNLVRRRGNNIPQTIGNNLACVPRGQTFVPIDGGAETRSPMYDGLFRRILQGDMLSGSYLSASEKSKGNVLLFSILKAKQRAKILRTILAHVNPVKSPLPAPDCWLLQIINCSWEIQFLK